MNTSKRILIGGYYGFGNAGDEAILAGMLHDLRALSPNIIPVIPSGNPTETHRVYGAETFPWNDLGRLIKAVDESDLVILGGGGLFHDYWGVEETTFLTRHPFGITYYNSFPTLAVLLKKPCMLYAIGVGPLLTPLGRSFTKIAFEQADIATVRDIESKDLLISLGIEPNKVVVTADPAFSLPSMTPSDGSHLLRRYIRSFPVPSPIVGVVVREWDFGIDPDIWEREVSTALDLFIEKYGGTVLFVPFQQVEEFLTNDMGVAKRISGHMAYSSHVQILEEKLLPEELIGILGACDLILGMRLHSLIFGVKGAVPVVGLSYDPKVDHFMRVIGSSDYVLDLTTIKPETLFELLGNCLLDRQILSRQLAEIRDPLTQKAQENAKLAVRLLEGHPPLKSHLSTPVSEFIKHTAVEQARKIDELELRLEQGDRTIYQLEKDIENIKESRSWRLMMTLGRIRRYLIPLNSRREAVMLRLLGVEPGKQPSVPTYSTREGAVESMEVEDESSGVRPQYDPDLDHHDLTFLEKINSRLWSIARKVSHILPGPVRQAVKDLRRRLARRSRAQEKDALKPAPSISHGVGNDVRILTTTFFDYRGKDMYYGGAERYALELVHLMRQMGFDPEIYQAADGRWVRYYEDVKVMGIDVGGDVQKLNQVFHKQFEEGLLTVYLAFNLAAPRCHRNNIGISHGVYWDEPSSQTYKDVQKAKRSEILGALANLNLLVSVDTNTMNWLRATRSDLADKCIYIPNFVDLEQFKPKKSAEKKPGDRIAILYPRRLYPPRGFWMVAEILPNLMEEFSNTEFHFVGRADPNEEQKVRAFMAQFAGRVQWNILPPHRMHEAYQQADITIIPTLYSEGTSLSCLEALASGNAVIATNIGGLPDLVISGHNGILIEPQAHALEGAIRKLINDPDLRRKIGERGLNVARAFNLERWREAWGSLLEEKLRLPS
jgi:polysaccharide pyruvyl transferase CsaB